LKPKNLKPKQQPQISTNLSSLLVQPTPPKTKNNNKQPKITKQKRQKTQNSFPVETNRKALFGEQKKVLGFC
jgi:hypothetical protein